MLMFSRRSPPPKRKFRAPAPGGEGGGERRDPLEATIGSGHTCAGNVASREPTAVGTPPVWSRAYGATWERYGYYSPALGPVCAPDYQGRLTHIRRVVRSSVALHAQRAGSTFIPRCQKLESSVKSCRRASRGASRLLGRREPSHLAACIRTHTGPVLGTLRFPGLSSSLKLFTRLRQAPRSAKITGRLSHFWGNWSPPDVRRGHLCMGVPPSWKRHAYRRTVSCGIISWRSPDGH